MKKKEKSVIWEIAKSISLLLVAVAFFGTMLGWTPFQSNGVSAYAVTEAGVANAENNSAYIEAPYTSIYDIRISDAQFNRVLKHLWTDTIEQVDDDLGTDVTPNEWLLRYAYYDEDELESVLNQILGVTLAADWRTSTSYIKENQNIYSNNGYYYNGYGDKKDVSETEQN